MRAAGDRSAISASAPQARSARATAKPAIPAPTIRTLTPPTLGSTPSGFLTGFLRPVHGVADRCGGAGRPLGGEPGVAPAGRDQGRAPRPQERHVGRVDVVAEGLGGG